ncbi:MAG TPA: hypothetical protein VN193_02805 [Candidatus Angelobacter sp.]|jgi:hypothetical protein|nr:hypothetical protein [Candidatus Angelobacter sp.]
MLATATAPATLTATCPPVIRMDLVPARTITVPGRVCSTPTLSFTPTGVAVAHFLLDCDEPSDPRLRVLAHRGTSLVDVTVWGADAAFVADGPPRGFRQRLIKEAADAGEPARWEAEAEDDEGCRFAPRIRQNVRVMVEGRARGGCWHSTGCLTPLPFGIEAERVQRLPIGAARHA